MTIGPMNLVAMFQGIRNILQTWVPFMDSSTPGRIVKSLSCQSCHVMGCSSTVYVCTEAGCLFINRMALDINYIDMFQEFSLETCHVMTFRPYHQHAVDS